MRHVATVAAAVGAAGVAVGMLTQGVGASVTSDWWVNGLGWAQIDYKLKCANGVVINGKDSGFGASGADACPDGSNSITWNFGAFWKAQVREVNNKGGPSYNGGFNQTQTAYTPTTFTVLDGVMDLPTETGWSGEVAVIYPFPNWNSFHGVGHPAPVSELLSLGIITPSQILYYASRNSAGITTYSTPVTLSPDGPPDGNSLLVYGYMDSPLPAPGAAVTAGMMGILLAYRRRR